MKHQFRTAEDYKWAGASNLVGGLETKLAAAEERARRLEDEATRFRTYAAEKDEQVAKLIGAVRGLVNKHKLLCDQLRNALGRPDVPDDGLVEAVGAMFVEREEARKAKEYAEYAREEATRTKPRMV